MTEKARFERNLMLHGFDGLEKSVKIFPRRNLEDLRAVSRLTMKICINGPMLIESETIADAKSMLEDEYQRLLLVDPLFDCGNDNPLPYPNANANKVRSNK